MSAARVASNNSSPVSSSHSLDSGPSTKYLTPLQIDTGALEPNALLNAVPNESGGIRNAAPGFPAAQATYTREEVLHCIQSTVIAMQRDQAARAQQLQASEKHRVPSPDCQVMRPRVHLFEHHPHKENQAHSCSARKAIATLELPGLTKADVAITARPNGQLLVTGERRPLHLQPSYLQYVASSHCLEPSKREEEVGVAGHTVYNELKFGRFQRVLRLPEGTDPTRITASMDDGMLSICWPLPCLGLRNSDNQGADMDRMQDVHAE